MENNTSEENLSIHNISSIVSNATVLESRILVYLCVVPVSKTTTQRIWSQLNKNCRNYSYLSLNLRNLEMRGVLRSHKVLGGRAKCWEVKGPIKQKVFELSRLRLGELLQDGRLWQENEKICSENDKNCNEKGKNCKEEDKNGKV